MAVLQGRTFEQLRVAVGRLLGAVDLNTTSSGGSTTTLVDSALRGGDDAINGMWIQITSGTDDGERRQASDYVQSTTTVTVAPAFTATVATSVTYEKWEEWAAPEDVEAMIQQATLDATRAIFDPVEDISLHGGGRVRWDIPTTFEMLNDVQQRVRMTSRQVIEAGRVWDESVDSDFTVTQDAQDFLFGRTATKFVIGSSVSAGDLASENISTVDLSNFTHIEFPIKVRTAVAASDLVLRLSATANGADTDKIIAIPALSAQTETWVRVAMSESVSSFDPSEATAIISVALEYNANEGANTVWLGAIEATDEFSYEWMSVPSHLWAIDKEARELVFIRRTRQYRQDYGYHYDDSSGNFEYTLMKLKGGDNPLLMSSDSDTNEVPDDYLIYRATALMIMAHGAGPGVDGNEAQRKITRFMALAAEARRKFPMLKSARMVT